MGAQEQQKWLKWSTICTRIGQHIYKFNKFFTSITPESNTDSALISFPPSLFSTPTPLTRLASFAASLSPSSSSSLLRAVNGSLGRPPSLSFSSWGMQRLNQCLLKGLSSHDLAGGLTGCVTSCSYFHTARLPVSPSLLPSSSSSPAPSSDIASDRYSKSEKHFRIK